MSRWVPRTVEGVPGGALTLFELADMDAALDHAVATGGRAPYGGVLWDAAPCVAQVLGAMNLLGLRVLELGCGTGLVSLACARAGAHVVATDVDETALEATRQGATRAGLGVETRVLDLQAPGPLPAADLVVAADLMYEPALATALAARVAEALARGARVVLGDPGRVGRGAFVEELARRAPSLRADFRPVVVAAHRADVAVLP